MALEVKAIPEHPDGKTCKDCIHYKRFCKREMTTTAKSRTCYLKDSDFETKENGNKRNESLPF